MFAELSTEMTKKDERSIMKRRLDEARGLVSSYQNAGVTMINPSVYDRLLSIELDLRDVMRESGLQLKMKESARFAMK